MLIVLAVICVYLLVLTARLKARADRQQELIDVPTVLTRFLSLVLENGHVCSSLDKLELCYNMQANAAGEATLTPVWRIETDTGEFFINAVTGLQETVT